MFRVAATTVVLGAAGLTAAGGLVALVLGVAWRDGIETAWFVASVIWFAVGLVLFLRWLVVGASSPALRVGAGAACAGLIFLGMWFEVGYVAHDGCASSTGEQPLLAVPVSLITGEPTLDNDVIFDLLPCDGRPYKIREFRGVS